MRVLVLLVALGGANACHGQEIGHLSAMVTNDPAISAGIPAASSSNPSGTMSSAATPLARAPGVCEKRSLDDDPSFILELGAANSWNTTGGATTFAPNFAAETTPIENWLELEAGVSPFFTRTSTEWDTDLLFKKPWTLSAEAEFMLGAGPEWVCLRRKGRTYNSASGEVAGDFMFWPNRKHRFGWYLEPVYDHSFVAGRQQSIGMSAGLLIGMRRTHR